MKIDQLQYFLETANLEHIGKASKVLAISPSAISHSISSLERELGRDLFEKRGKRIYLTPHGKLLKERASELLMQVESIKEEVTDDKTTKEIVSVGTLKGACLAASNGEEGSTKEEKAARKAKVKAMLKEYDGALVVKDIPEDKRNEVFDRLKAGEF